MNNTHNVIIIGAGCAGLSAAVYCARAELKPLVFAGDLEHKGGLLVKTSIVENYPGFSKGILGMDLVEEMENQAIKYGATVIDKDVLEITKGFNVFMVKDTDNKVYYTKTIIVATGSTPNKLNLEGEDRLWSNGISSCAVCDGALYKNKKIVVIGAGDSACEESTFLTKFSNVIQIHRRDSFRASSIMQKKVLNDPKITVVYDTIVTELVGKDSLESITIKNVKTGEETRLEVDGLFYGLGLKPNSTMFKGFLEMDEENYIIKYPFEKLETMTSVKGIFVAGDVSDKVYRQAVVAAGDGCKAALDVNTYINEHL